MNLISSYLKDNENKYLKKNHLDIKQKKSMNSMMLKGLNQVSFSHILREGNSVADDSLARKGLDTLTDYIAWF
jgi:hypothetical protein